MLSNRLSELILFDKFREDAAVNLATELFDALEETQGDGSHGELRMKWFEIQRLIAKDAAGARIKASLWQNRIAALIAGSENSFSLGAEKGAFVSGGDDAVFKLAASELEFIKSLYRLDFGLVSALIGLCENDPSDLTSVMVDTETDDRRQVVDSILTEREGISVAAALAKYYADYGAGDLEAYDSFLWEGKAVGIENTDPITFDDLIGCEPQKAALIENAEILMSGIPASNVLLYGDSGTGKSSSVKALLNRYKDKGLKLIALPKSRLAELPELLVFTAKRGLKFIIFIDDLSFEGHESGYKQFKSVIEGGVRVRPDNVIVCVTSNRKNIVRELWKDREGSDDVHIRDNMEEKRSLADRFGLSLAYLSPDKAMYLRIARAIAIDAGIDADNPEFEEQAMRWEIRHGGRSGRTASQFVDYLTGIKALETRE